MRVKPIANAFGAILAKNSTTVLTGLSIAGVISTAFLAAKATPRAVEILKQLDLDMDNPSILDKTKAVWVCFVPTFGVGATTILCIVGMNSVHLRRKAALAALYSVAETGFAEYQAKVVELLGANKEEKVRDEIAKDRIRANPPLTGDIILTGGGEVICYDSLSGRYFKSDVERIRRSLNELNRDMLSDNYVTLNELYDRLGLSGTKLGDIMGWDSEKGLIEILFSTQLTEDDKPCLVLNFTAYPRYVV